ncbi:MAG: hypothetical protein QW625_01570 [Candidatus Nanoarchaeia archaeon]
MPKTIKSNNIISNKNPGAKNSIAIFNLNIQSNIKITLYQNYIGKSLLHSIRLHPIVSNFSFIQVSKIINNKNLNCLQ